MITLDSKPALKTTLHAAQRWDGALVLLGTPRRRVVLSPLSPLRTELLLRLDGAATVREIVAALRDQTLECSEPQILDELNELCDQLLLEDARAAEGRQTGAPATPPGRHGRNRLFFAATHRDGMTWAHEVEAQLRETHVALVGLGGYGSHIFYQLTALGIGELTAVDFDQVEWSNLNRQSLYGEPDLGRAKTEVARERAAALNSSVTYHFAERRIASPADFVELTHRAHLVILAADTPRPQIYEWLNQASYVTQVPALYTLGAGHSVVNVGPLVVPGETACFDCARPRHVAYDHPVVQFINARHRTGVLAPAVLIGAGMLVQEAVKHLAGFEPCQLYDQRISLDLRTYARTIRKVQRRAGCPFCAPSQAVRRAPPHE